MFFSIIIPAYNVEFYLQNCVYSILLNESRNDYEIIIVDDGSTDKTGKIADLLKTKYPSTVKVIHQLNGGLSSARNTGIESAVGDYIVFVDADDELDINALSNIKQIINQSSSVDIIVNRIDSFEDDSEKRKPYNYCYSLNQSNGFDAYKYLLNKRGFTFTAWTFVVSTKFIHSNSLKFIDGILHEDEIWTNDILLKANNVVFNNCYYYYYRHNRKGSIMNTPSYKHILDYAYIIKYLSFESNELSLQRASNVYWSLVVLGTRFFNTKYNNDIIKYTKEFKWISKYSKNRRLKLYSIVQATLGCKLAEYLLTVISKVRH